MKKKPKVKMECNGCHDFEMVDSAVEYIFEKMEDKLRLFDIEFKEELAKQLKKQTEEILVAVNRIIDRTL